MSSEVVTTNNNVQGQTVQYINQSGSSLPQPPVQQSQQIQQQRTAIAEIPMKQGEVLSQYLLRKQVYKNAMKELNDHDKAYCYANVYANITFLFAKYPQSLTETVMKYAPNN